MSDDPVDRDIDAAEQSEHGPRLSRLRLLQVGAVGIAGATAGGAVAAQAKAPKKAAPPKKQRLEFFTPYQFALVTEMAEQIFPTDETGPGARVAKVGVYIDGQLAGGWGRGSNWYMHGPFIQPTDTGHGWQVPLVPRDVYRASLPAVDAWSAQLRGGARFVDLSDSDRLQVMNDLRTGRVPLSLAGNLAYTSADFFALFRQNVLEGMFADPKYGGNQGMVGWKWVGFPGDPMRHGDDYYKYIFTNKPYPKENKPLPMLVPGAAAQAKAGTTKASKKKASKHVHRPGMRMP